MSEGWLVLSDRKTAEDQPTTLVEAGLFVVELAFPIEESAVLLDYQSLDGWHRTFTLFHDPSVGLVLIHRQGPRVVRHALAGPLPHGQGTARLSLSFDAPSRHWQLRLDPPHGSDRPARIARGQDPLPLHLADIQALSQGAPRAGRHRAVMWFGLTRGAALPARAPWIGQRTPVVTARGPVMAGHLKSGDLIATADGGLLPLLRARRMDLPACGSFAPVILRAPFYGSSTDILVSADQRVALSGPEVEYLFNEDEVLVEAGALVDGRTALADHRRAVASVLSLEFAHPCLILADGCQLLIARPADAPPRRVLQSYETLTLMAMLGRAGGARRSA